MSATTTKVAKVISNAPPAYAVIDLGTNSCRLLIARDNDGNPDVIDSFSDTVSLGEGLASNGEINEKSFNKAIDCLKKIKAKIQKHNVVKVKAVATEACRRAKNSDELLNKIHNDLGIKFEIIDAKQEAELASIGCSELCQKGTNVIFDIGGGSTQIIITKGNNNIIDFISMPYGVLTLTQKIGKSNVNEDEFNDNLNYIKSYFADLLSHIDGDINIIGTSGTITTVTAVYMELPTYNRKAIDGKKVNQSEIMELSKTIATIDEIGREKIPSINKNYAKLMMGGCIILYAICDIFKSNEITVVDRGIREGLLKQLIKND